MRVCVHVHVCRVCRVYVFVGGERVSAWRNHDATPTTPLFRVEMNGDNIEKEREKTNSLVKKCVVKFWMRELRLYKGYQNCIETANIYQSRQFCIKYTILLLRLLCLWSMHSALCYEKLLLRRKKRLLAWKSRLESVQLTSTHQTVSIVVPYMNEGRMRETKIQITCVTFRSIAERLPWE